MRKVDPFKPAGYIEYNEVNYPFEKVGIDLLGLGLSLNLPPIPETLL